MCSSDLTAKPVNQGILRFIMGLARWMNLSVVAEGVETRDQLVRLREIGCDYVQGYYFARPMPCAEFEALLSQRSLAFKEDENSTARTLGKRRSQVILVADEDAEYRTRVRRTLEDRYQVVEAADGDAVFSCMADYEYKLAAVILSMTLADPDGLSVLDVQMCIRDSMREVFTIDGRRFSNMAGFYDEVERVFTFGLDWKMGRNLNAFNDILRGGFGRHEYGQPIHIRWLAYEKSFRDLGKENMDTIVEIILDSACSGHDCTLEQL